MTTMTTSITDALDTLGCLLGTREHNLDMGRWVICKPGGVWPQAHGLPETMNQCRDCQTWVPYWPPR